MTKCGERVNEKTSSRRSDRKEERKKVRAREKERAVSTGVWAFFIGVTREEINKRGGKKSLWVFKSPITAAIKGGLQRGRLISG